jgi:hypothetical protein
MANKRIVIRNGGIYKIIETNEEEKCLLKSLEKVDMLINEMRSSLREGEKLKKNNELFTSGIL